MVISKRIYCVMVWGFRYIYTVLRGCKPNWKMRKLIFFCS